MQYKPAYLVVNNGRTLAFVGNYDSYQDVKYDFDSNLYEVWTEKDCFMVRLLTPAEYAERQQERRNPKGSSQWWLPAA